MRLEIIKKEYIEYLRLRNYSESTMITRNIMLGQFIKYLKAGDIETIEDVTEDHINSYKKYRYYKQNQFGRNDKDHVQNKHIFLLKMFFEFSKNKGYINYNIAENLEPLLVSKILQEVLNDEEVKKILSQPDINTVTGYRDRTILEILYSTAIRSDELCSIEMKDVKIEEGIILIRQGKGKKDRLVPIGKYAKKYLENYIKYIRLEILKGDKSKYLFINMQKNKIRNIILRKIIKRYKIKAGIKKNVTPHTFRRSCATEMIKRKANLMYVKEILGHESLESLKPYCRLNIEDLKKAHDKYHPRERVEI